MYCDSLWIITIGKSRGAFDPQLIIASLTKLIVGCMLGSFAHGIHLCNSGNDRLIA
ncbi:hypothetical protein LDG_5206 [Legionella drancourtii LLAP12]|uniref:Uncharacterized protein n=1 Tax=Legionella drancourtii LLAP12 TaxID=658187 RepID=G9EJ49_9GAMM|nr:hypothetical protein LDG_5206 [Legionella drancourtii LLAP12]